MKVSCFMSTISTRDFFYIIFKRKYIIFVFFILSVLLGVFVSYFSNPVYEADAKILVKIGRENIYNPEGRGSSPLFTPNKEEQINSEIEILKNPSLLSKVVETIGVEKFITNTSFIDRLFSKSIEKNEKKLFAETLFKLKKDSHVEKVPNSDVIQLSYKHSDPVLTAKVINTWIDQFFVTRLDIHVTPQSLKFYRVQSDLLKNRLKESEAMRAAFVKRYNISHPKEERKLFMKQISSLNIDLNKTISKIAQVESKINEIRNQLEKTKELITLNDAIKHSPNRINALHNKLLELKEAKNKLKMRQGEDNSLLENMETQINKIVMKLDEQNHIRNLVPQPEIESVYQGLLKKLANNEIELKALLASKQAMQEKLSDYQEQLEQLAGIETEFNNLEQKIAVDRQNYSLYLTKLESSRISSAMNQERISNVRLINPAQVPMEPISPKIVLNIILSVLIGIIGGFGLAFFLEYLDDSLETVEDVEDNLDLPVLTSIPAHQ